MHTLLIAEIDASGLNEATAKALTAAVKLGSPVDILVAGSGDRAAAEAASRLEGVARVRLADDAALAHRLAEPLAELVISIAADYDAIVAPATAAGKNVLPRIAALLDVMQVSEVTAVLGPDTFERPIYAGNAIETVQSRDGVRVLTVRTAAFPPTGEGSAAAPIEALGVAPTPPLSTFVGEALTSSARPELAGARIVVSGGRALGSSESFETVIAPRAARLNAAIGASRAAVDAGFAGNDLQVGQTGKVVAPDLYVAVGISGAIQHLAGMKDSKVIVAINKDAEAPIFQVADYGLVEDLFTAVPALVKALDD